MNEIGLLKLRSKVLTFGFFGLVNGLFLRSAPAATMSSLDIGFFFAFFFFFFPLNANMNSYSNIGFRLTDSGLKAFDGLADEVTAIRGQKG